jgi:hypothetical protein
MPNADFGISQKPCYFCGNERTIQFGEDPYIFCPNCSAIYTFMTVWDACSHCAEAPVLVRYPWNDDKLDKPFIYAALLDDQYPYRCSECDQLIVAEGWE